MYAVFSDYHKIFRNINVYALSSFQCGSQSASIKKSILKWRDRVLRTVCTSKHTGLRTIGAMPNTVHVDVQNARPLTRTHEQYLHRSGGPCRTPYTYKYTYGVHTIGAPFRWHTLSTVQAYARELLRDKSTARPVHAERRTRTTAWTAQAERRTARTLA